MKRAQRGAEETKGGHGGEELHDATRQRTSANVKRIRASPARSELSLLLLGERGKDGGAERCGVECGRARRARVHSPHPRPRLRHSGIVSQLSPISLRPVVALAMNRRAPQGSAEGAAATAAAVSSRRLPHPPPAMVVWARSMAQRYQPHPPQSLISPRRDALTLAARNERRGATRVRVSSRATSLGRLNFFSLLLVALRLRGSIDRRPTMQCEWMWR